MKTPRKTLIDTITEKAHSTFGETITKDNFDQWANHWLKTAESIKNEFLLENLIETAKAVESHIEFNKRLISL